MMGAPRILGHRGASRLAPENTLAAFRTAVESGADGIEYDVQLSRDGRAMVFHDDDLDRTTSGRGPVAARSRAQLRRLEAGLWQGRTCRIPDLHEVLAGGFGIHDLELKVPSGGRLPTARSRLAEASVPAFLEAWRSGAIDSRSAVTSFDPGLLAEVAARWTEVPFGPLVEDIEEWDRLASASFPRPPAVLALRAPLLPRVAPEGTLPRPWSESRLWVWGLPHDDPRPWLAWGPESVLVDDPARARALLPTDGS